MGFSFHGSPELLDRLLREYPQIEFVQLQINYLDWNSEWIRSRECYETAEKYNKQVVVMEPVKGGTLASVPEKALAIMRRMDREMTVSSWAVRFAASLKNVMVVLSGMSTPEQLDNNTTYMSDFQPLTEKETAELFKVGDIIREDITIPCTGCSYCTEGCPQNIAIPRYFSLYNEDMRESKDKGWTPNIMYYKGLSGQFGKAGDCVECGQCEDVCPQHLPIIEYLKDVAGHYEET